MSGTKRAAGYRKGGRTDEGKGREQVMRAERVTGRGKARPKRKEERQLVISGWVVLLLVVTDWDGGMGKEREKERFEL